MIVIFCISCHDEGPDPIDNPNDPIDTMKVDSMDTLVNPYDDIIGTYNGNMYIQDHQYDFPTATWTNTFDTINYTFIIEGVDSIPNGSLKLVVPQSSFHYYGTKEEFSQDTISFQDHIGSLNSITEWLTIFRKEHKLEKRSKSTNNGSPSYRETMYVGYK